MAQRLVLAIIVLFIGALGFKVFDQGRQIDRLAGELKALRNVDSRALLGSSALPVAASPTYAPIVKRVADSATEPPAAAAPSKPEARVPVTHDDVARVESAVLSLLEADRPELREKLRAVVQEQQQTLEQEQREQRRERWAARREARLLEVGKELGLSDEQRAAILHIMLSTRDQIIDVRQSAQTPEAINESRTKSRALREQSETQIRELMKPEQYETYRARLGDDDDDDERRPSREGRGAP